MTLYLLNERDITTDPSISQRAVEAPTKFINSQPTVKLSTMEPSAGSKGSDFDFSKNMENVLENFSCNFSVDTNPNSTTKQHPRFSQYKIKRNVPDQTERRERILASQKSNRFDIMNHIRRLTEGTFDNMDAEEYNDDGDNEEMEVEVKIRRPGRYYKNQLMFSEWLIEVPMDFPHEWLMTVCPVGKRCLVISSRGSTTAYSKSGYRVNTFPSSLPGGNRKGGFKNTDSSVILDCLFNEVAKTFYVLDIMSWRNYPLYDSETEFRSFWMHSKFEEFPELSKITKINPYKFLPLPYFECTEEAIAGSLNSANFEVDGLLFFHKRTHYTFGSTPLVLWLKPYMVPEILNIPVPGSEMAKVPSTYSCFATHVETVKADKVAAEKKKAEGDKKRAEGGQKVQPRVVKGGSPQSKGQKSPGGGTSPQDGQKVKKGRGRGIPSLLDLPIQDYNFNFARGAGGGLMNVPMNMQMNMPMGRGNMGYNSGYSMNY